MRNEIDNLPYELFVAVADMKVRSKCMDEFRLTSFSQIWSNTSGAKEAIGGAMMIEQQTYIFHRGNHAYVYFGGEFGYECQLTDEIRRCMLDHNMPGIRSFERDKHTKYAQ